MSILLEANNLTKAYSDSVALKDFSIQIPKGSIYGLLGPNGAGKTTFIRMINQITAPDEGDIFINGEKLQNKHIAKIGYMPEERGLYKNMQIGEQCIYLARLKGMSANEAQEKLNYWFDKLDINKWWKKKLSELSKGMAQKIQFVVTVLHQPDLLIFDEPFSGFDPVNANLIRDEILELRENGATIIFSTHRMESVEQLCDHVALINKSEKVLDGEINAIREQHKQGKYEFSIKDINPTHFEQFEREFRIEDFNKKSNYTSFKVKIEDSITHNNLLEQATKLGQIQSFYEVIPTMNEIFINAVK